MTTTEPEAPGRIEPATRVVLEGYTGAELAGLLGAIQLGAESTPEFHQHLADWLAEQADDPTLEAAMMVGSLETSPFRALMNELTRRAGE